MDSKLNFLVVKSKILIDQAGIPPAFMDEFQTDGMDRTFTFLRNESMAGRHYNKTACNLQCKEQARQAQWYGDSDCLPAERSWDLNDTKKGKGARNETETVKLRGRDVHMRSRARAWSESVVIWQGIAGLVPSRLWRCRTGWL